MDRGPQPLLELSAGREALPPPGGDQTPLDFDRIFAGSKFERVKREIGRVLYPGKNRLQRGAVERRLRQSGVDLGRLRQPDVITWGQKGFGLEIFLQGIARRMGGVETVVDVGCGTGSELLSVARFLRPKKIIGVEYFNYDRAWRRVGALLRSRGTEVEFLQCDLRNPLPWPGGQADLLLSVSVLEHVRDMSATFANLAPLLRRGGSFAALWGPMWYSYSGDHIAAELGFDKGYEHVRLPPDAYLTFYKTHPRNAEDVQKSIPTWLELGLHNFARYRDYIYEITAQFGDVRWLGWQITAEGWRWRKEHPNDWQQMLQSNPQIDVIDLLLGGAFILTRTV